MSEVASIRESAEYVTTPDGEEKSNVIVPRVRDYVFPMWIVTVLPVGLSGLILAGVFAAGFFGGNQGDLSIAGQVTTQLIAAVIKGDLPHVEALGREALRLTAALERAGPGRPLRRLRAAGQLPRGSARLLPRDPTRLIHRDGNP